MPLDKGVRTDVAVHRAPEGGWWVGELYRTGMGEQQIIFASTSFEEVVKFLGHIMVPVSPEQGGDQCSKD